MSILVVGGHERMERDYKNMAKDRGFKSKVYTKMCSKLTGSIGNPDAIVILTSTVSHKLTRTIEGHAKKYDIPIIRNRNSSKAAFCECLTQVEACLGNCKECKAYKCCCNGK